MEPTETGVILRPRAGARLHLGCGDVYLSSYLNVDYPPGQGIIGSKTQPDVDADIKEVLCQAAVLRELRMHHVFEHFDRVEALALLVRWYEWLSPDGLLVIETPDFEACVEDFDRRPFAEQQLILRHLFGSQEAGWARHLEGWSEPRFREVATRLGYEIVRTEHGASDAAGLLRNVTVWLTRSASRLSQTERLAAGIDILRFSMNGDAPSELALLAFWRSRLEAMVEAGPEPA